MNITLLGGQTTSGLFTLKRHNHAKIIRKSVMLFWLPGLHIKPIKALANRASGVNKLLALIGDFLALKFCLPIDHFYHTQQSEL